MGEYHAVRADFRWWAFFVGQEKDGVNLVFYHRLLERDKDFSLPFSTRNKFGGF